MKYAKSSGFTLIELLASFAIIAILTTFALVAINLSRDKAKTAKAQHEVGQVHNAIIFMALDSGFWPNHQEVNALGDSGDEICADDCACNLLDGCAGLLADDISEPYNNWAGPYLKPEILIDPWGKQYFFNTNYSVDSGGHPCNVQPGCVKAVVIGSYGPDGVGNGQYGEDDIIKIIYQ